ncbi:MAG: penicillin-binding protein 2 [Burkholderiales bacterium]|nr:MAG: penicillin-binding protein 2 [Burkholderiales bacterium]
MPRAVRLASNPLLAIKLPAWRSHFAMFVLALSFLTLAARAVHLQLFSNDFLQAQGEARYARTLELPATRGKILDRNGVVLATSLPAYGIWASPEDVDVDSSQLGELARLLQVSERELKRRLARDSKFVYLQRQVEPRVAASVRALGIAGVHLSAENKRHYPEAELLAHVVGFTDVEDVGQEGVELAQQRVLGGRPGLRRVIKDRLGHVIEDVGAVRLPHDGGDLTLSIDTKIQYLAFAALKDAVREHKARAGAVVVLDAHSGEILAMTNWPTYNPADRSQAAGARLRNRAVTDVFEPGSTLKPFTAALALELGRVRPSTMIDLDDGRIRIGGHTIRDVKSHGPLTVAQVIQKSSNVGTVKLAMEMPARQMWELYTALGFGQAPNLGFPGVVAGRVRPYRRWRPVEQATMSFGHGISVSLIQLARAYTVFASDGELLPLSLVRRAEPAGGVRVLRPSTAHAVRDMLEQAAGPEGTGPRARVTGYRVAGKTGTAHKLEGRRYGDKYIASFVGLAPASDPRVIVAVMIDEPSAGKHYGGEVAAPVFARIAGDSLRLLGVQPDAPFDLELDAPDAVGEST